MALERGGVLLVLAFVCLDDSWFARPANVETWRTLAVGVLGSIAPHESSRNFDGAGGVCPNDA